jgi:hypothetical protein
MFPKTLDCDPAVERAGPGCPCPGLVVNTQWAKYHRHNGPSNSDTHPILARIFPAKLNFSLSCPKRRSPSVTNHLQPRDSPPQTTPHPQIPSVSFPFSPRGDVRRLAWVSNRRVPRRRANSDCRSHGCTVTGSSAHSGQ